MYDTEVITAEITVYCMNLNDKDEIYKQYADKYNIHFILRIIFQNKMYIVP